jgi:hypothetical protein
LFLAYLFNKQFPWNGKLEIVYDFSKPNAFIGRLTPEGRVDEIEQLNGDYFQTIKIDPVYFDLELPASYEQAVIEVKYQSQNQPVIEIGGLVGKDIWNFQTKPIQNSVIDGLINKWHKIQQGDVVLLQREKKYDSIGSFLGNLPPINEIAVFNYSLPYDYSYPDYIANDNYLEIEQDLKGKHSFYTYLGEGENMDFSFWLQDINEHNGSDEGQIEIYHGREIIKEYFIADDGINNESQEKTDVRELPVNLNNVVRGYYKINLQFSDDIIIKKIKTKQNLITFINKLNLYNQEEPETPINLFSNSSLIRAATNQVSGLQTIKIGGQNLDISDVNIGYAQELSSQAWELSSILIPKGNIIIQGPGLFSFSKKQFFNPLLTVLDDGAKLNGINYIIANYQPPFKADEWNIGRAILDLPLLHQEKNKVKIMISAPNLDQNNGNIKITRIKIILEGKPFLLKILGRLNNWIKID